MRMARVNVYLPNDLADEVRLSGLNVSGIAQQALRAALASRRVDAWLKAGGRFGSSAISHDEAMDAMQEARAELWGEDA
jgi:post-segregation antitoxin (ccd killing protein)